MAQSNSVALSQYWDDFSVVPDGSFFRTELFTVEAIPGGYRCFGDGFDFTAALSLM